MMKEIYKKARSSFFAGELENSHFRYVGMRGGASKQCNVFEKGPFIGEWETRFAFTFGKSHDARVRLS